MASDYDCQECGACCSYSYECPQFRWDGADIAGIPADMIDEGGERMQCDGDRCCALRGTVGYSTSCIIYDHRPEVCRDLDPGSEGCRMARRFFGLEAPA